MRLQANSMISHARTFLIVVLIVATLLLLSAGATIFLTWRGGPTLSRYIPEELVEAKRAGDELAALEEFKAIASDPTKTAEEKAIATLNAANAPFRVSGRADSLIPMIQDLKKNAIDPSVSAGVRAYSIAVLATMYNTSGRDPIIFTEVFRDKPFSDYVVPNSPDASSIRLGEWSYGLRPTITAAAYTAQLYASLPILDPSMPKDAVDRHVKSAEMYLDLADGHAEREIAADAKFVESHRYLTYRNSRAIVVGLLAISKGAPYDERYRAEFEDALALVDTSAMTGPKDYKLFERWQYARALLSVDNDSETAKRQLDLLAQELNAFPNPDTSSFVAFLRNERGYRPQEVPWKTILAMFDVSPAFEAAVEKVTTRS